MVRTDNKQVWLVDEKLQTFDKDWEEVDSDATLETYSNNWEELESDAELYVYDSLEGTDIGSVEDYQWGWEWPFTIVWKNYDGTVLETDEGVVKDTTPTYDGATPTKPATAEYTYTFTGWSPEVKPAKKDQTYTAQFKAVPIPPTPTYTITWEDYDGTTLATESVEEGQTPVYPSSDPTREGYTFTGWNPVPYSADKNQTYVAQYEPAVVEISSTYLNCFSSKNDQWNDVYYFNLQIPWNTQSINLEFKSQAWELYRTIDNNGTSTTDTITDQTVIAAYSDYVDDLFDPSNTAQFTEEQFNHLKDITVAEDTAIYTVAVDPDNSNKYILSKVVGGSTAESFTWESGYWDVSWEWIFRVVRTVNQVEDLSTVDTYTDLSIQNLCFNTMNNYGGQFFSGNVYNFIKYYTLDTEFITFRLHDNSGEYYSAKTYLGEGWATPYVEMWHTVTVTTSPDTITNVFDGNTYTITGQEATDDIAWILSHTAEESGSTPMSEQDFSRFGQLGVERFQMWNIDVAGKSVSISDNYEGYGKEEYRAYYADAEIMEITTRAGYTAQSVAQKYESNASVYQAVADYCTQNNINAWGEITSTQYSDLKAIFETYKWDPIYNYVFNLWSNPSDNDLVFQIIQQREVSNQWEDWNKVEIHKDGNWWFYVTEMINGATPETVWIMSASQYADFWTAATAIGYDVTNQWYQTMIQWTDFLNLKGAVENNMSDGNVTLYSGANGTIVHNTIKKEITLNYTGASSLSVTNMVLQDRDVWASEYLGESATASNAYWNYYCWGWPTPFNALPTNENQENWSQVQTPAPTGYHIMSYAEFSSLLSLWESITWLSSSWDGNTFMQHLLVANAWRRDGTTWELEYVWAFNNHWLSDYSYGWDIYNGNVTSGHWGQITPWYTLRCVKDVANVTVTLDCGIMDWDYWFDQQGWGNVSPVSITLPVGTQLICTTSIVTSTATVTLNWTQVDLQWLPVDPQDPSTLIYEYTNYLCINGTLYEVWTATLPKVTSWMTIYFMFYAIAS